MPIKLANFPQLRLIAWNRCPDDLVDEDEAFALYERNWRWVEQSLPDDSKRQLPDRLVHQYGSGVLNA